MKNAALAKKDVKSPAIPASNTVDTKLEEVKTEPVSKVEKSESREDVSMETPPAQALMRVGMSLDEPLTPDDTLVQEVSMDENVGQCFLDNK